jgi:PST family polysaccharide transporter
MSIVKTSALTASSTFIKLATAFAINKAFAIVAGPAGLAMIGQVQNVGMIIQGLSSGMLGTAVVKYTAEWRSDEKKLKHLLGVGISWGLTWTIAVASVTCLSSSWLAQSLLNDANYWWIFTLLAFTAPLSLLNSLFLSFLNGIEAIKQLTVINIAQSIVGLLVSLALPLWFGLPGALASLGISSIVVLLIITRRILRSPYLGFYLPNWSRDAEILRLLPKYAATAVVSVLCTPLCHLWVRELLVQRLSLTEAGYWQCLGRFSGAYMVFFTTLLSVYYLPRFTRSNLSEVARELPGALMILLAASIVPFASIWLFRAQLVATLFAPDYVPATEFIHWQLIGDLLKLSSWLLATILLARGATGWYMLSEVAACMVYAGSAWLLVGSSFTQGFEGAVKAHAIFYSAYLLLVGLGVARIFRKNRAKSNRLFAP